MLERLQNTHPAYTPTPLDKNDRHIKTNAHTHPAGCQHSQYTRRRQCPSSSTTIGMSVLVLRACTNNTDQRTANTSLHTDTKAYSLPSICWQPNNFHLHAETACLFHTGVFRHIGPYVDTSVNVVKQGATSGRFVSRTCFARLGYFVAYHPGCCSGQGYRTNTTNVAKHPVCTSYIC